MAMGKHKLVFGIPEDKQDISMHLWIQEQKEANGLSDDFSFKGWYVANDYGYVNCYYKGDLIGKRFMVFDAPDFHHDSVLTDDDYIQGLSHFSNSKELFMGERWIDDKAFSGIMVNEEGE